MDQKVIEKYKKFLKYKLFWQTYLHKQLYFFFIFYVLL